MEPNNYYGVVEADKELIRQIAEGGDIDLAIDFAKTFLKIFPNKKLSSSLSNELSASVYDFQSNIDKYQYVHFLRNDFQKLINLDSIKSFNLLCEILFECLNATYFNTLKKHKKETIYDISRQAIEDHSQNSNEDSIKNALINKIRDLAILIIKKDNSLAEQIISILESKK
jgi:hypothetical protein